MFACLNIWRYRHLIVHKAWADFRAESQRTYLGVLWWVLDPIITTTIYYLVFGKFFNKGGPGFIPFLTVGVITWMWFFTSVTGAARSILTNVSFVRQVSFNKIVFPSSHIIMCSYQCVFSMVVLFGVLFLSDITPTRYWFLLPVTLVSQLLLMLAAGLILGAVVPFLPDLASLIRYILRLVFFLSGIMYNVDDLSPKAQAFLRFNPMVHVISAYRDILMYAQMPDWRVLGILAAASLLGIYVGAYLIWRFDKIYAKRIVV